MGKLLRKCGVESGLDLGLNYTIIYNIGGIRSRITFPFILLRPVFADAIRLL